MPDTKREGGGVMCASETNRIAFNYFPDNEWNPARVVCPSAYARMAVICPRYRDQGEH